MKKIAVVAALGFVASATVNADTMPFDEVVESAAVETAKPVVVHASATELDGADLAVDELLKIANTEEESLRMAAVEVLAEMGSTRARAVLGVILHTNRMATVRAAAADQLGNLGDGESIFALALALEMERDAEVRDVIQANLERNLPVEPVRLPEVAMAGEAT